MVLVDPLTYFKDFELEEGLLFRFAYSPSSATVDLVSTFAAAAIAHAFEARARGVTSHQYVPPPRDFRRLLFLGVSAMRCRGLPWKGDNAPWRRKIRIEVAAAPTITLATVSKQQQKFQLEFRTDQHWPHTFNFESLYVDRRLGKGEKRGESWAYFDVETGEEFDLDNPFPDNSPRLLST